MCTATWNDVIVPVAEEELRHGVITFALGSDGDLDALRPQILKDVLSHQVGEAGAELSLAIRRLLDLLLVGGVPEAVRPVFFGASLTPLKKKSGGIRPIAVGCVWRRLSAKIVLRRISPDLVDYLKPHQLGVGVKGVRK